MSNTQGYYERYADRARQGKVGWNKTPIFVTAGADATDPLNGGGTHPGDRWWQHADVEPQPFRDQGERFARSSGAPKRSSQNYGRDSADPRTATAKENESMGADDVYEFADYLPSPDEDVFSWLANLRIYVEATPEREAAFDALSVYVHTFSAGARGADLDKTKLHYLLTALCEAAGGLLKKGEQQ